MRKMTPCSLLCPQRVAHGKLNYLFDKLEEILIVGYPSIFYSKNMVSFPRSPQHTVMFAFVFLFPRLGRISDSSIFFSLSAIANTQ